MAFERINEGNIGSAQWMWRCEEDRRANGTVRVRLTGRHHVTGIPQLVSEHTWAELAADYPDVDQFVEGKTYRPDQADKPAVIGWEPDQRDAIMEALGPTGSGRVVIRLTDDQADWWDHGEIETAERSRPKHPRMDLTEPLEDRRGMQRPRRSRRRERARPAARRAGGGR